MTPQAAIETINKECDETALAESIKALEEVQQYREIGTVEECRKDREKQSPKEGIATGDMSHPVMCPTCNHKLELPYHYCIFCGQNLIYSKNTTN